MCQATLRVIAIAYKWERRYHSSTNTARPTMNPMNEPTYRYENCIYVPFLLSPFLDQSPVVVFSSLASVLVRGRRASPYPQFHTSLDPVVRDNKQSTHQTHESLCLWGELNYERASVCSSRDRLSENVGASESMVQVARDVSYVTSPTSPDCSCSTGNSEKGHPPNKLGSSLMKV